MERITVIPREEYPDADEKLLDYVRWVVMVGDWGIGGYKTQTAADKAAKAAEAEGLGTI